jgi:hypothetical protein
MNEDSRPAVKPADAAFRAGARYVYCEAYSKGYEDGWARAWAEAFNQVADDFTVAVDSEERSGGPDLPCEEDDQCGAVELSDEWAEIFAAGSARRAAAIRQAESESTRQCGVIIPRTVDLGGGADEQRNRYEEILYGERALELRNLNASLDAAFSAASSRTNAPVWPAVSLADVVGIGRQ